MRLMNWIANYKNGTVLNELENEFGHIQRDMLHTFCLTGLNTTFTHFVDTGIVTVNENIIKFNLNDQPLGISTDIINYKEKMKAMINGTGIDENAILGYYTGWKESNSDFSNIEVLFWVDMVSQELKVRFRATPLNIKSLISKFIFNVNGVDYGSEIKFTNIGKSETFVFELFAHR